MYTNLDTFQRFRFIIKLMLIFHTCAQFHQISIDNQTNTPREVSE